MDFGANKPGGDIGVTKPIDFSVNLNERRAERQRRRETKKGEQNSKINEVFGDALVEEGKKRQIVSEKDAPSKKQAKATASRFRVSLTALSFLLMVMVPSLVTVYYYYFVASPQYQVETQFSVRGSSQGSVSALGLGSMFGSSMQSGDSYIVASYVESLQLIRDVKSQLGIDLRQYFVKDDIDYLYEIEPDMPLEKFVDYWRDMTDVAFNSTTGNVTFYVYAFSAEDSKAIADAVLKVSETLVNNLSENSRLQLTQVASKQVERAEARMKKVREDIQNLRSTEQEFDPVQIVAIQNQVTQSLESQLSQLRIRLTAVTKAASAETPSAKVIKRQIDALEQQLAEHKSKLSNEPTSATNAKGAGDDGNLSAVLAKFEELTVEQGFATQAYTTSLAALESALMEAQKQERYFATFVMPAVPEIALYPLRMLDSFIAFLVFLAFWLVCQFLFRSIRDHAV
jgi:capsular polysaccharide transport system permease protein